MKKNTRITRSLICIVLATVFSVFIASGTLMSAFAASGYATLKGFNVENWTYIDDLNTELVAVNNGDTSYGSISLWSSRYIAINEEEDVYYITVLVEAKIAANGDGFANEKMQIKITHRGAECDLVVYAPEQVASSYTVSEGFSIGVDKNGPKASYSFQTAQTYSEIDMTVTSSNSSYYSTPEKNIEFVFSFNGYDNWDNDTRSPFKGTIIQRISVTYAIENWSQSNFDSDLDKTIVSYTGTIRQHCFLWFANSKSKTIEHTIYDLRSNVDTYSNTNSNTDPIVNTAKKNVSIY